MPRCAPPFSVHSPIPDHCRRDGFSRLPSAVGCCVVVLLCCLCAAVLLPLTNHLPLSTNHYPPPTGLSSQLPPKYSLFCHATFIVPSLFITGLPHVRTNLEKVCLRAPQEPSCTLER